MELAEEIGREDLFVFGLTADDIASARRSGYYPFAEYERLPELRAALDMVSGGAFSPKQRELFRPLCDAALGSDEFMVCADFESYVRTQAKVSETFGRPQEWARLSILNVAGMGRFSSDRAVREYAEDIWGADPVPIER
jgi:starch phosphorylase